MPKLTLNYACIVDVMQVEPPPIRDGSLLCAQSVEVGAPLVDGFTVRMDGTPRLTGCKVTKTE